MEIIFADDDGNFELRDGSFGNPGCECGEYDAVVKINGVYLCAGGIGEWIQDTSSLFK